MLKVSGHFIADGSAVNVDVGFIPDKVYMLHGLEETNPVEHIFIRELANTGTASGQYGLQDSGGTKTKLASAAAGFATYDTTAYRAILPAPNGSGERSTSVADYSTTTTYTARSSTALGSVVRPTTHNGFVYECTTASGGAAGTEPSSWGTTVGGTTTAGSGDVWTCRDEKMQWIGVKGFTVGATLSTDTDEWYWEAEKHDSVAPEQDSASYDPVGKFEN